MDDRIWKMLSKGRTLALFGLASLLFGSALIPFIDSHAAAGIILGLWAIGLVVFAIAKFKVENPAPQSDAKAVRPRPAEIAAFEEAKDPVAWLRQCDARNLFPNEIEVLERTYRSVEAREPLFEKCGADTPFSKAFGLIKTQVRSDVKSCGQFMASYYPSSGADKSYLYDLMKNSRQLVGKLDKLVEAAIDTESAVDDVDTRYVDDFLESLQSLAR